MTTKVTIDAHAGWPVRVMKIARSGTLLLEETVPAGEKRDYHITQDDWIKAIEQAKP